MAHFLVVDDDELILKVSRTILQKAGHTVVVAKDGHAALEQINRELFNMIITDANMPGGISGFVLVSTIRKIERFSQTPIMFLTGRKDKTDVARAIEAGVDDYVVKPIDPDLFLAKIESLLNKKGEVHTFKMTPVKVAANWSFDTEILGLSEQGIQISSKTSIPMNSKIKINSELFEAIGFPSPQIRIVKCAGEEEIGFIIEAHFVGLSEGEMQMIRRWVMANSKIGIKSLNKPA
jgi:CheY-like chemotaxis protein